MASSAWTATKDQLVRELAQARAQQKIALTQLEAERALTAAQRERRQRWDRENKRKQRERQRERHLTEQAKHDQELAAEFDRITPDPNADQHRRDLLAALKEKP